MNGSRHAGAPQPAPFAALILGLGGLVPFVGLAAAVGLGPGTW